ncbi:hypothetical protein EYF80_031132 [Liparis tanakae]|uniref:Uncharacterized protein n=1 Tax=Liparis tanakae TaxID=230148 RepID=A0A4Z2GYT9_9TELE|nr:hypothetical protein EYF80_031132 [Liparis tanakae]
MNIRATGRTALRRADSASGGQPQELSAPSRRDVTKLPTAGAPDEVDLALSKLTSSLLFSRALAVKHILKPSVTTLGGQGCSPLHACTL